MKVDRDRFLELTRELAGSSASAPHAPKRWRIVPAQAATWVLGLASLAWGTDVAAQPRGVLPPASPPAPPAPAAGMLRMGPLAPLPSRATRPIIRPRSGTMARPLARFSVKPGYDPNRKVRIGQVDYTLKDLVDALNGVEGLAAQRGTTIANVKNSRGTVLRPAAIPHKPATTARAAGERVRRDAATAEMREAMRTHWQTRIARLLVANHVKEVAAYEGSQRGGAVQVAETTQLVAQRIAAERAAQAAGRARAQAEREAAERASAAAGRRARSVPANELLDVHWISDANGDGYWGDRETFGFRSVFDTELTANAYRVSAAASYTGTAAIFGHAVELIRASANVWARDAVAPTSEGTFSRGSYGVYLLGNATAAFDDSFALNTAPTGEGANGASSGNGALWSHTFASTGYRETFLIPIVNIPITVGVDLSATGRLTPSLTGSSTRRSARIAATLTPGIGAITSPYGEVGERSIFACGLQANLNLADLSFPVTGSLALDYSGFADPSWTLPSLEQRLRVQGRGSALSGELQVYCRSDAASSLLSGVDAACDGAAAGADFVCDGIGSLFGESCDIRSCEVPERAEYYIDIFHWDPIASWEHEFVDASSTVALRVRP